MIIHTDDVLAMLKDGYTTVPDMVYHILDMEPMPPSRMDERTRRDYRRISQQLCVRLGRMKRWGEVECVGYDTIHDNRTRVWRAVA